MFQMVTDRCGRQPRKLRRVAIGGAPSEPAPAGLFHRPTATDAPRHCCCRRRRPRGAFFAGRQATAWHLRRIRIWRWSGGRGFLCMGRADVTAVRSAPMGHPAISPDRSDLPQIAAPSSPPHKQNWTSPRPHRRGFFTRPRLPLSEGRCQPTL